MADAYHALVAAIQRENRTAAGWKGGRNGGRNGEQKGREKAGDRDRTGDLNLGKVAL
jgi:hypothetical protein